MTDDKTQRELRIQEEAEQRAEEKKARQRKEEYYASRDRGGDGTRAFRRGQEATKDFL